MKKIKTLFKKNPENLGRVINEVDPDNQWVFEGLAIATQKFDGTACAIINGKLFARYDVKKGRAVPHGAIPCQEPDEITGHWPHWVECEPANNQFKWHFEAFNKLENKEEGTYELIGEKIQGNPEGILGHCLVRHGEVELQITDFSFEGLKKYLTEANIEGIVFHNKIDGRMCKLRKKDFGIKRLPPTP